ncbi:hypothetical protein [Thalassospira alkalitolerans]|uniref:hypothetical protein n=1 Tax=Thalassospira alkalitolerans TaxID=1293890 RepID=UPI003AA7F147
MFSGTIVWSVSYWVVYPSWPTATSYTGMFETTNRTQLHETMANVAAERTVWAIWQHWIWMKSLMTAGAGFSMAGVGPCLRKRAPCHGTGGSNNRASHPWNDDWLWGGSLEAINKRACRYPLGCQ